MKIRETVELSDLCLDKKAKTIIQTIIDYDEEENFESYVNEKYPDGISISELNILLLNQDNSVLKMLGISDEDDEDDEVCGLSGFSIVCRKCGSNNCEIWYDEAFGKHGVYCCHCDNKDNDFYVK